jgi:hypothetical protein
VGLGDRWQCFEVESNGWTGTISWWSGSDTLTTVSVPSDLRIEVLTVVVTNVAIFWDIVLLSPYVNRRFEEINHLHLQGRKSAVQESSVQQVARPTRRHIPENGNINFISLLLFIFIRLFIRRDRFYGLVVRVPAYRS